MRVFGKRAFGMCPYLMADGHGVCPLIYQEPRVNKFFSCMFQGPAKLVDANNTGIAP